jgi:transposase-like protein
MERKIRMIRKMRKFSEEFKRSIVHDFESGKLSIKQLGILHGISLQSIYKWVYRYSKFNEKGIRIVERAESSEFKIKQMQAKIEELERSVGQKQIAIDYLEKMIELAQTELGIDIKKNFNSPHSSGSNATKRK